MYATFVAPVHQYSTETEPSRQASFNFPSRQPSFKAQNSSEVEATVAAGTGVNLPLPPPPPTEANLSVPAADHRGGHRRLYCNDDDDDDGGEEEEESSVVQDIYEQVPVEQWPLPPLPPGASDQESVQEISQAELEHQLRLERYVKGCKQTWCTCFHNMSCYQIFFVVIAA